MWNIRQISLFIPQCRSKIIMKQPMNKCKNFDISACVQSLFNFDLRINSKAIVCVCVWAKILFEEYKQSNQLCLYVTKF